MRDPFVIDLLRTAFKIIFLVLTRPEYRGQEHIPASGPFLLVTNHLSYVDPPFIFIALNRSRMTVLAADTYKSQPFYRWIIELVGGVWINRGSGDRGALRAALSELKAGKILGMAPEGTRSRTTRALQPGKSGAAFIASKAGVPVLPIGLVGTEQVASDLKRLRRPRIVFNAGPVFYLPSLDDRPDKSQALDEYTHEIMCRIAALLPEKYHGVFSGDPRIEAIRQAGPAVAERVAA